MLSSMLASSEGVCPSDAAQESPSVLRASIMSTADNCACATTKSSWCTTNSNSILGTTIPANTAVAARLRSGIRGISPQSVVAQYLCGDDQHTMDPPTTWKRARVYRRYQLMEPATQARAALRRAGFNLMYIWHLYLLKPQRRFRIVHTPAGYRCNIV